MMAVWLLWLSIWMSLFNVAYQSSSAPSPSPQLRQCNETQALLEFKRLVNESTLLNWHAGLPYCNWEGVECSGVDKNKSMEENSGSPMLVTKLKLQKKGLKGVISGSLGCLYNLKEVNLSFNLLSGAVPAELFQLQHIETLDLSFNNLSGTIPPVKGFRSIQSFNISNNFFSGKFPEFDMASNLTALIVYNNSFTGHIPTNICKNSSSVRILNFSTNKFNTSLSEGLADCQALEEFNAGSNDLVGSLPDDIFRIPSLRQLLLPSNSFSGNLSASIGDLRNLTVIELFGNNISGILPEELGKLEKIEQLMLSSNKFSGFLPNLTSCKKLQVLDLRNNSLIGTINLDFKNFPDLVSLDLATNHLTGNIPATISNCKLIRILSLAKNHLYGEIPDSFRSLPALAFVSISNNSLINATSALTVLQECRNLTTLILSLNFREGHIPTDITGFRRLKILALGKCGLSGQVPKWLQNCKDLQVLDLSWNKFTGSIPPWLGYFKFMFYLDMSKNFLSGDIPLQLTQLQSLTSIQNLTATDRTSLDLPLYVKHNKNASGLQYNQVANFPPALYLSNNRLEGRIWPGFGQMKLLHILDLSRNNLMGTIPDTLSNMANLENLDLSGNNLSGRIPASLRKLTFLAKFNVANNHLEGPIPTGGQFFSFPISGFEGNSGLCGSPLPVCNSSIPVLLTPGIGSQNKLGRNTILGITVSIGVGIALLLATILWSLSGRQIENQDFENEDEFRRSSRLSEHVGFTMVVQFQNWHNKDLTIADLIKATNNFDQANIVGCGGFGLVYKATLADGRKVAIKKLTGDCLQMDREFRAEVEALSRAQHKNLVSLQGYCIHGNDRLLIYSYMENGSLDYWLHERPDGGAMLDWETRLKIVQGAGGGLVYLHRVCEPHIVHRDIKSSNILLNDKFEAHLADFGLSRLILPYNTHVSTELVGTLGYIPPEYGQAWIATLRGDVYSFGVVILELLTGKRPIDICKPKGCRDLVSWVQQMRSEGKEEEIFDPLLKGKGYEEEMSRVLDVGCICTNHNPLKRPTVQEVVSWLENVRDNSQQIKTKF